MSIMGKLMGDYFEQYPLVLFFNNFFINSSKMYISFDFQHVLECFTVNMVGDFFLMLNYLRKK